MTVGKQSNNNNEKVSFILVVQDIDRPTAATYDTSYNVEQHQGALTLLFRYLTRFAMSVKLSHLGYKFGRGTALLFQHPESSLTPKT